MLKVLHRSGTVKCFLPQLVGYWTLPVTQGTLLAGRRMRSPPKKEEGAGAGRGGYRQHAHRSEHF